MKYNNQHLIEVYCGYQFQNETLEWDSTYFGRFYEQIKVKGFTEKQERKGFQITFDGNLQKQDFSSVKSQQIEDQMIFKNNEKGWAIIMGKNLLSFHIVKNYPGWDIFVSEFIKPFTEIYKNLGLGAGARQCNIVYLNKFTRKSSDSLSDYFKIISPLDKGFGVEKNISIQRVFENENNFLVVKMNSLRQIPNDNIVINLECGAICKSSECMNGQDWIYQANETHKPIFLFFESIITENLKKEL